MGLQKQNQLLTISRNSKLDNKSYRDAFLRANVSHGLSYQIKTIRKSIGLSQRELAVKIGAKSQSVISRLEDPSYGKISITTLEKIAAAFDVALIVRFSSFGDFLEDIKKTICNNVYSYEQEISMHADSDYEAYIDSSKAEIVVSEYIPQCDELSTKTHGFFVSSV